MYNYMYESGQRVPVSVMRGQQVFGQKAPASPARAPGPVRVNEESISIYLSRLHSVAPQHFFLFVALPQLRAMRAGSSVIQSLTLAAFFRFGVYA